MPEWDAAELRLTLAGRVAVGRAVGILMGRYGFTQHYARSVLDDLAQDWDRTPVEQALHIISHGVS